MLIVCPSCASAHRVDAEKVGLGGRSIRCASCRETWFLTPSDALAAHEAALIEAAAGPDPVSDAAWREASAAVRAAAEGAAEPHPASAAGPVVAEPSVAGPSVIDLPAAGPAARRGRTRAPRPSLPGRLAGLRARLGLSRSPRPSGFTPAVALGLAALAALPLACLARTAVVRAVPQSAGLYALAGLPVNLRGVEIRDVVAFSSPADDGRPAELVVEGDLVGVGAGDVPVAALTAEIRDAGGRGLRAFTVPAPRAVLGPGESARFRASLPTPPAAGREVELRFADAGPVRVAAGGR